MLTACQKIKRELILNYLNAIKNKDDLSPKEKRLVEITAGKENPSPKEIEEQYDALEETGNHWDFKNEFREGQVETKLPTDYSRHYECKEVASKMSDGSWVGWTYWHGGGKHGEPESVEWMEYAYDLEVTETEKMVVVREFKKIEG